MSTRRFLGVVFAAGLSFYSANFTHADSNEPELYAEEPQLYDGEPDAPGDCSADSLYCSAELVPPYNPIEILPPLDLDIENHDDSIPLAPRPEATPGPCDYCADQAKKEFGDCRTNGYEGCAYAHSLSQQFCDGYFEAGSEGRSECYQEAENEANLCNASTEHECKAQKPDDEAECRRSCMENLA